MIQRGLLFRLLMLPVSLAGTCDQTQPSVLNLDENLPLDTNPVSTGATSLRYEAP